jgi:N-acetylmuramoyl-L-alanine amidase
MKIKEGLKIGGAVVHSAILPKGKVTPNETMKPTHITIHNTASPDAPAKNFKSYINTLNKTGEREASWHFSVDDKEIYQFIDTSKVAWHTGTSKGNHCSIGIEICEFKDSKRYKAGEDVAIALVIYLMKELNIPLSNVVTHESWSGKHCPRVILDSKEGFAGFKKRIQTAMKPKAPVKPVTPPKKPVVVANKPKPVTSDDFRIKIITNNLWVYNKPDWKAKYQTIARNSVLTVDSTLTVAGSKMYKLKSGLYITANPSFVAKIK